MRHSDATSIQSRRHSCLVSAATSSAPPSNWRATMIDNWKAVVQNPESHPYWAEIPVAMHGGEVDEGIRESSPGTC